MQTLTFTIPCVQWNLYRKWTPRS